MPHPFKVMRFPAQFFNIPIIMDRIDSIRKGSAMTKDEYRRSIMKSVELTLRENYERIGYSLLDQVEDRDDLITMETKMLRNAISISCQISMQLMSDMLEQAGIIQFDEEPPRKTPSPLHIVPSDTDPK